MFNIKLQNLPPYAKIFTGITTGLMLGVCLWAVFLFYVDKGLIDDDAKPLYLQEETEQPQTSSIEHESENASHLRHNVGLAHTHINGQTLLYFVLGFLFLFTSVKDKVKKLVFILFGTTILLHTIGLSGDGFHWIFDDLLAISGVGLLVLMPYMSFLIIVDLFKKAENA